MRDAALAKPDRLEMLLAGFECPFIYRLANIGVLGDVPLFFYIDLIGKPVLEIAETDKVISCIFNGFSRDGLPDIGVFLQVPLLVQLDLVDQRAQAIVEKILIDRDVIRRVRQDNDFLVQQRRKCRQPQPIRIT